MNNHETTGANFQDIIYQIAIRWIHRSIQLFGEKYNFKKAINSSGLLLKI